MRQVEYHRYRYTDYLGRRRTTRHHLTAEDARQQLSADAEIVPGSAIMRWQLETTEEMDRLRPGVEVDGPGSGTAEICTPTGELARRDGAP